MAASKVVTVDKSYKQLTTNPDFLVQNISRELIEIVLVDTGTPLDTLKGIKLKPLDILSSSIITGVVWGRVVSASAAVVSVTE